MAARTPIPLTPIPIRPGDDAYTAILNWPFAEQPFYQGQIKRLLQEDIPERARFDPLRVWVYRDPAGKTVGFGTLAECDDYQLFTRGREHFYIPLLAVHPLFQKKGHGQSIVEHLANEADFKYVERALELMKEHADELADEEEFKRRARNFLDGRLFLDVYTANQPAVSLYKKCGFEALNEDNPILDPHENNEPYIIMAKIIAPT